MLTGRPLWRDLVTSACLLVVVEEKCWELDVGRFDGSVDVDVLVVLDGLENELADLSLEARDGCLDVYGEGVPDH